MQRKKRKSKPNLIGRDPCMGRVDFKTGRILSRRDRARLLRKSKAAKREKDEQCQL